MEPVKKTKTVEVEYWCCGRSDHQHKTEKAAIACISRRSETARPPAWSLGKCKVLAVKIINGLTVKDAAAEYGVSGSTVQKYLWRALRRAIGSQPLDRRRVLLDKIYTIPDIRNNKAELIEILNELESN